MPLWKVCGEIIRLDKIAKFCYAWLIVPQPISHMNLTITLVHNYYPMIYLVLYGSAGLCWWANRTK